MGNIGGAAWGPILFLDLGRVMGWAAGQPGDRYPASGSIALAPKGASSSAQLGECLLWLLRRLSAERYRMVAFESPVAHMIPKQSMQTRRMLLGYPGIVEAAAYASHIQNIREASLADIRRNLLGRVPGKGEDAKAVVQAHLRALGCPFEDNNAADAIAGWYYASTVADKHAGERVTPLFKSQ